MQVPPATAIGVPPTAATRFPATGGQTPTMDQLERLVSEAFDGGEIEAVIRPAARLPEWEARAVQVELSLHDVCNGGHWRSTPSLWERYDQPWRRSGAHGAAVLLGSIQIAYGTPTTYEITIYRVTITPAGARHEWTVESLCNEALGFAGLDLATCPRVDMAPPPKPFRYVPVS